MEDEKQASETPLTESDMDQIAGGGKVAQSDVNCVVDNGGGSAVGAGKATFKEFTVKKQTD